ncbi:2',3'-cyclic-nucleotide 2'-phosphodiesterase (5'-nucleotidase family) [Marisediminicola sp. UYEF4]|uniref:5'-nucleotidase C-terminal domain-containing protein n=1 Tax=Marisediminicola sp. UYEF4 TaxID=1756384 RepID=UPI00339B5753
MHDSLPSATTIALSTRPRSRRGVVASAVVLTVGLSAFAAPPAVAVDHAPVSIDVLTTNDFHGRLEANRSVAGAAVLGGLVNAFEANNPNTLLVGAGDLIGASTFTSFIQDDQPTIDALNEIGLDTSALGNHEFDRGRADLDDRVIPAADWDYLSANIYETGTTTPAYQEYSIETFEGVRVGFIGATTEDLPSLVSPTGIASLAVGPVVPAVNRVADRLSDGDETNGEADVLIMLVHEGAATTNISSATDDSDFGRLVSGVNANVDAIVSAHTHLAYNHQIPIAGTDRIRPVISAGQYGEQYGAMNLQVDPTSKELLSITSEVKSLAGAFLPDPEVAAIVSDAVEVASVLGSVKVGDITADFNRARRTDGQENRGGESTLSNFVADVQLWATQSASAEIALMNPGGLRANLTYAADPATAGDADGLVTFSEAAGVQPFANTLVAMDLTSEQLKAVLEEQWQPAGSGRPFLKLGLSESLTYAYDPTAAAGSHITAMYVNGVLVQPGESYRVTVNSFLAGGGDNFFTLASGTNRADTGRIDLQSMVDYFVAFPVNSPPLEQRAVGVKFSPADADGYNAGEMVTIDLSSLLFSAGEANRGTAVVSLGDTVLGSAPIDPTIIDTTDEVGRASIVMTVPEGVFGPQVLTVSVPETGTSVSVPFTFADEPITALKDPKIAGNVRVGFTVRAVGAKFDVTDAEVSYQWNRDGVAIDGATDVRYTLTAADAGTSLTVTATASAEGYADGTATSHAKLVKGAKGKHGTR